MTNQLSTQLNKEKIGIFGGTFDPIHYGHLNSIETVLSRMELDRVIIVPTSQNPLKDKVEGPSPQERFQMVQLALPYLNDWKDFVSVSDIEIQSGGPSYTIETLRAIAQEYPDAELFLILGADQLEDFDRWKNFDKILEIANLIVTSRPGKKLPSRLEHLPTWLFDRVDALDGFFGTLKTGKTLQMLQMKDLDISATEVRSLARRGMDISNFTPQIVAKYVTDNVLYDRVGEKIKDFTDFTKFCAGILTSKGAINVQAYDVHTLDQPTDFTIVCSGTSSRHVGSMIDSIAHAVKEEYGVYPQGKEGMQDGRWAILDYGGLMVHIFYDFVRNEYRLEELWRNGKRIEL